MLRRSLRFWSFYLASALREVLIGPGRRCRSRQRVRSRPAIEFIEDRTLLAVLPYLVSDINPSGSSDPSFLASINRTLFFAATDGSHGQELWRSDGTPDGTVLVKDIRLWSSGSSPRNLVNVNGTLFFAAWGNGNDRQLWKSDGTAAGTVLVRNFSSGSNVHEPAYLTNVS